MNKQEEYLNSISDIKKMMENSSKFISLSGLSGITAGIWALLSSITCYVYFDYNWTYTNIHSRLHNIDGSLNVESMTFLLSLAIITLLLAISTAIYFTKRKANNSKISLISTSSINLIKNLTLPLSVGFMFCIGLIYNNDMHLIAPSCLIFYGLSLISASKYTLHNINYLGISQIILGIIGIFFIGYGFILWILGFGILHIVYGIYMYYKYENINQ